MDIELRRLDPGDEATVLAAGHLFDETPRPDATRRFLAESTHHMVLATGGDGRAVGFVSGVETTHPDKGTEMFLYELSVDEGARRRGIGRRARRGARRARPRARLLRDVDGDGGRQRRRAAHLRASRGAARAGARVRRVVVRRVKSTPMAELAHRPAADGHGHRHGLVDPSIRRSRDGLRAVALSLVVLTLTAGAQAVVFLAGGSVALLADLIHNAGDAATAIPLGVAFLLRSERAERAAGLFVVAAIFVSACVAGYEAVDRLLNPHEPDALLRARRGRGGRLGRQHHRRDDPDARRPPPRQPGADRRRRPRPRRRLRRAWPSSPRPPPSRPACPSPTRSSGSASRS